MKTPYLLAKLAAAGVVIFADGEDIKLRHLQPLDTALIEMILQQKPEVLDYLKQPNYTLWFYQIDTQPDNQHAYTRMGLMTADHSQAQQQLETMYNKPITNLQRSQ